MTGYLNENNPANEAPAQIKKYINLRIDLLSLHFSKKMYRGLSIFILSAVVAFAILFFMFFASYSFIMWYNDYYGNASTGAFIVSGFYLLLALLMFMLRKPLIYNPLKKSIYNRMEFEEFHKETIVQSIRNDEDFEREIERVQNEIDNSDQELDYMVEDVKEYYSFDAIKDRFVEDLFSNPKPMVSTFLQGIMAFRSFKGKHFGRSKRK